MPPLSLQGFRVIPFVLLLLAKRPSATAIRPTGRHGPPGPVEEPPCGASLGPRVTGGAGKGERALAAWGGRIAVPPTLQSRTRQQGLAAKPDRGTASVCSVWRAGHCFRSVKAGGGNHNAVLFEVHCYDRARCDSMSHEFVYFTVWYIFLLPQECLSLKYAVE